MSDTSSPLVLGIAERAAYVSDGNTNLSKWNVLGLRNTVLSNLFPINLPPSHLALALPYSAEYSIPRIVLVDQDGKELGFITIAVETLKPDIAENTSSILERPIQMPSSGWGLIFVPLDSTAIIIERPGTVYLRADSVKGANLGQLNFVLVDPPPLSPERIAAIRSDPGAMRAVRVAYGCRHCDSKLQTYAALERDPKIEKEGWIWFSEIPNAFQCACGKTNLSMDIIRRNLHVLLGLPFGQSGDIRFAPLYEQQALSSLRESFVKLLSSNPREEVLQKFIEKNPVLLHPFPAARLFIKPPLLTEYFADFAIVTPKKELLLIEIEKTSTKILKKDGGVAADLVHAFDQVRSWLQIADEHLLAVLDSLKVERAEVSRVRGVVIAGRDIGADAHHLRRLKGQDWGRIELLTFDDLLYSLDSLISRLAKV